MRLDLTAEWDAIQKDSDAPSQLITGVVVARKAFIEENPEAVSAFMDSYAASVDFVNANIDEAAELVGKYEIVPAAVAQKAIPACNITFIAGGEMKQALSGYLSVLFDAEPEGRRRRDAGRRLLLRRVMKKRNLSLWAVLFWLLVWQAGSMALHSDILLVSPLRVLQTLLALVSNDAFLVVAGLARWGASSAVSCWRRRWARCWRRWPRALRACEELLAPLVLAMKTVPVASFIILALIWFGSRNLSVFIALLMVFPVMYTNVLSGIRAAGRQPAGNGAGIPRAGASAQFAASICRRSCRISARAARWGLACAGKRAWRRRSSACPCPPSASACSRRRSTLTRRSCSAWTLVIVLMSVGFEKLFMAALGALERRLTRL